MSRYKAYEYYQKTPTDWLGDAPSHWKTIPVGRLYKRIKRTGFPEKEMLSVYRDYGVIPTSSRDDNNNKPSEDITPYQLVEPDDLVMNKMKAWQGSIAISEYEGIVSPAYFVYKPLPELGDFAYPKYIHYLLRHPIYIAQYLRQSKGIRVNQWDLDPEEFQRIDLLLPEKKEQEKIFQFLDHETAKIDNLIAKQQELIKLLKEKRQAVISHAVTKGLNPNAPMRDSGVEWLGEVPAHWDTKKLKYLCDLQTGDKNTEDAIDEGIYPFFVRSQTVERLNTFTADCEAVLTAGDGAGVGKVFHYFVGKFDFHQRVYMMNKFRFVTGKFFFHYLENMFHKVALDGGAKSTVDSLRMPLFLNFQFTVPPRSEQLEIIKFIEKNNDLFNRLTMEASKAISLMQERRTALISAAVTGKIDVRDWQPPSESAIAA